MNREKIALVRELQQIDRQLGFGSVTAGSLPSGPPQSGGSHPYPPTEVEIKKENIIKTNIVNQNEEKGKLDEDELNFFIEKLGPKGKGWQNAKKEFNKKYPTNELDAPQAVRLMYWWNQEKEKEEAEADFFDEEVEEEDYQDTEADAKITRQSLETKLENLSKASQRDRTFRRLRGNLATHGNLGTIREETKEVDDDDDDP